MTASAPVRVSGPAGALVELDDLLGHLRQPYEDDHPQIEAYRDAAESYLDGPTGLLGRCMQEQQWAITFGEAGTYRLPMNDISAVSAVDADDAAVEVTLTFACGSYYVEIGEAATVTMTAAMPEHELPKVRQVIRMLVAHWFNNREAVGSGTMTETPMAVDALLATIRRKVG